MYKIYIQFLQFVPPHLVAITCGNLPAPANGAVVLSGNNFRDTATYSCNTGYVLYGKGIRDCGMDGQWGGKAAECKGEVI